MTTDPVCGSPSCATAQSLHGTCSCSCGGKRHGSKERTGMPHADNRPSDPVLVTVGGGDAAASWGYHAVWLIAEFDDDRPNVKLTFSNSAYALRVADLLRGAAEAALTAEGLVERDTAEYLNDPAA